METGLKGKTIVITGAANGIGRAAALAFAREGANLGLLDFDERGLDEVTALASDMGIVATATVADLSDADEVNAGMDQVLGTHGGRLDVLVNNVGAGAVRSFDDVDDQAWRSTMELNFMSYVRAIRKALPILRQRGGVIINNASDLARQPEPVLTCPPEDPSL